MRKWYTYLLAVIMAAGLLFCSLSQSVLADDSFPGIYDDAGILTAEEKTELSARMAQVASEKGCHLMIVTTEDTQGKDVTAYADDFFEAYNSDGTEGAGLLFLIDMQHRELYISTSGDAIIQEFTDAKIDSILDDIYNQAANGDFYESCVRFLDGVENSGAVPPTDSGEFQGSAEGAETISQRVYDEAGLLEARDIEKLEKEGMSIEKDTGLRTLIVTTEDVQGMTSRNYAETFFKAHNDSGRVREAIVYLINMKDREIYIYTAGDAATEAFTESRIDKMLDKAYKDVADGKYGKSCESFLEGVSRYAPGKSVGTAGEIALQFIGCVLIGGIAVFFMSRNRGGKIKTGVNNYFVASTAQEAVHRDAFLNRTVTRRKIERRDNDDKPGGGSSVHRSASGTLHGGGGRSFGGSSGGGGRKF